MLIKLLLLVGVILLAYFFYKSIKSVFLLALNSVIGIFALIGFNYLFNADIEVNFWSVVITAIGGIVGFIVILASHYLGGVF